MSTIDTDLTGGEKAELLQLSICERWLVLQGLYGKLLYYKRTGKMSFSYNQCPVCNYMGATEEDHETVCKKCPIYQSCRHPFYHGFQEDMEKSSLYFKNMLDFLLEHRHEQLVKGGILVVGGTWGSGDVRKKSSVVEALANNLGADLINGGPVDMLPLIDTTKYGLVIWMPNVSNEKPKYYPKKKTGGILVCSKVMHTGVTCADAAQRIFAMHANAVIEITIPPLGFRVADALNNTVCTTQDLLLLASSLVTFAKETQGQKRLRSVQLPEESGMDLKKMDILLGHVQALSKHVENQLGERYFGNASTRCVKLFPTSRDNNNNNKNWVAAWVSQRNVDKRFIGANDMVWVGQHRPRENLLYRGKYKPSVDTAIQLAIYRHMPQLNFMIHGHAYVKDAPYTEKYFPCGDLREVPGVYRLLAEGHRVVNLLNHGFLITAESLDDLDRIVSSVELINRL